MESFFALLASASLLFTWVASTRAPALLPDPSPCSAAQQYEMIAAQNAATLRTASFTPFGRLEQGWQIYEPQVAAAVGATCPPDTKRFAASVAQWQSHNRLRPTGAVDIATISAMKQTWQHARPFIKGFEGGVCPKAATEANLATIASNEGWLGKPGKLDRRALAALRRMVAAARADDPRITRDRRMLTIVSAFRSPAYDAARCKKGANCNGVSIARCSAHRTGTAVDLYVGAAPGRSPVDSDNANRLYLSKTPTYRWLVKNAARYGFVNYVFEPWHWEWVGSPPASQTQAAAK